MKNKTCTKENLGMRRGLTFGLVFAMLLTHRLFGNDLWNLCFRGKINY